MALHPLKHAPDAHIVRPMHPIQCVFDRELVLDFGNRNGNAGSDGAKAGNDNVRIEVPVRENRGYTRLSVAPRFWLPCPMFCVPV